MEVNCADLEVTKLCTMKDGNPPIAYGNGIKLAAQSSIAPTIENDFPFLGGPA